MDTNVTNTLDLNDIQSSPGAFTVPEQPPTSSEAMVNALQASQNLLTQQAQEQVTQAEQNVQTGEQDVASLFNQILGEQPDRVRLSAEQGLPQMNKELRDLQAQATAQTAAYLQGIQNIGAKNIAEETRNVGYQSLDRQRGIDVLLTNSLLQAKQGNIEFAQTMVDNAIAAKYDPLKTLYRFKLETLDRNYDRLTKAEQKLASARQASLQTELKKIEKREADEAELKDLAMTLSINQAPTSVVSKMMKADSIIEALEDPEVKKYLVSEQDKLNLEKIAVDIRATEAGIRLTDAQRRKINEDIEEMISARNFLGASTGDAVSDIIAGSARYGDQRLTDSQLTKIQQALNALGSMETLQGLLMQGKDGINLTGPVTGRVRSLVTKLGGDADAAAINATIQGIIPTIARGIFGEVGVLTDTDIANYRKTVPNLTSTEDQNKLVSIVMYDVLSRSISNTLMTNAKNQTNVSNFLPDYMASKDKIMQLKTELGYVEEVPIAPENQAKMEAGWVDTVNQTITNSLNSFLE